MKAKILLWSITVALGGFLFGFDTAVISGAEQTIQDLWELSDINHGLAVAIALYGTVIGAMFGGLPADRFGRRKTLFWIAALYLVSALGSALAPEIYSFMLFRFIGGLGVGASSVVAPMYISEVSPAESRGRLVSIFQFNIVLGILIAYFSNYLIQGSGEYSWRIMLGVEVIPAFIFLISVLRVPESPRWLILHKGDMEEAKQTLLLINPEKAEENFEAIRMSAHEDDSSQDVPFLSKAYRFPIMLAFLFALFNQFSGINAIIYYAPRIFGLTGVGASSASLSTVGIGLTNLVFTLVGMSLIDKMGRKILMYIGSVGLITALGMVSYAFYSSSFQGVQYMLFAFIGFFAMSQGAVIWVFLSEIFPNRIRGKGQSLGSFTHWLFAAFVANAFPFFVNKLSGGPIFLFFSIMMVLQLIFVWRVMPETKGVSLEKLEERLTGK